MSVDSISTLHDVDIKKQLEARAELGANFARKSHNKSFFYILFHVYILNDES